MTAPSWRPPEPADPAEETPPRRPVLDDLPRWMPGGLVAAFGLARRHTAAALLLLLAPLVPIATQATDALVADDPGHSSGELVS